MQSFYTLKDGLKHEFERRWNEETHGENFRGEEMQKEFPINKTGLVDKFYALEQILNENWHPKATLGAAIAGDGLLTDHGVGHINAVMHHANDIIGINKKFLNGYEIYILLIAIHFHDLGNIYGREKHEEKIDEIISILGDSLPLDMVEKQFVFEIAKAHGGNCNEDKDTIRYVNVDDTCNGIQVKARTLAAILRFADEISDDFSRSEYLGMKIPEENEVFHAYSQALEPVSIEGETIKYHFRIPYKYTQEMLGKGNEQVFLYDEILMRLTKCMRELEYCSRYANGFINITTLNVTIDIMDKNKPMKKRKGLSFRLNLFGYPNEKELKIDNYLDTNDATSEISQYRSGEDLKNAMEGEYNE